MDWLGAMYADGREGKLSGDAEYFSRIGRCSPAQALGALRDLHVTETADVTERNAVFTVINRRMFREHKERRANCLRQQRFRELRVDNALRNGDVPSNSTSYSGSQDRKGGVGGNPTLKEVLERAQMVCMQPEDATAFWNHFESSGWIDKNGNPVVSWTAKMDTWKATARALPFEKNHHQAETGAPPARVKTVFEIKTILDAKLSLANDLRGRYCSEVAMGTTWSDKAKATEYVALCKEIKALKLQLSKMG